MIVVGIESSAIPKLDLVSGGVCAALQTRFVVRTKDAGNRPFLPNLIAHWRHDARGQVAPQRQRGRSVGNDTVGRAGAGRARRSIHACDLDEVSAVTASELVCRPIGAAVRNRVRPDRIGRVLIRNWPGHSESKVGHPIGSSASARDGESEETGRVAVSGGLREDLARG